MRKFCLIALLISLYPQMTTAQDKGQIININQNYQIAFTDLGSQALKTGDLVKVFLNNIDFVYMQVLESSAILSKLGVSHKQDRKTDLKDLGSMAIGNSVVKAGDEPGIKNNEEPKPGAIAPKAVDIQQTSTASGQQENSVDFDKSLSELKDHLNNMGRILDQK